MKYPCFASVARSECAGLPPQRMKIVHAIFSFLTGGAETMLVDIINQQCKAASVALIVVNDQVNLELLNFIDNSVDILLIKRKTRAKRQLVSAYWKIYQVVNRISPDIIHCHDNNLFPFFVKWRPKTCITVHNVQLSTAFLNCYKQVFAISTAVREDIQKRKGIDAAIIYNGIELEEYLPRNNYNFDPSRDDFKIVQVSRLFPVQKGQHIAVQAIHLLKEQYPDLKIQLYFVGDGEAFAELQTLVSQYSLENQIKFMGQVNRDWIKKNLQNYHLLIQPSLFEGFGLTVVEGFVCGLPVIASNLDGPKEIIRLLGAGLLTLPDNPVDLAEKIYQIYQSYLCNTLKDHSYAIQDRNKLKIFDIQTTANNYMLNYSSPFLQNKSE